MALKYSFFNLLVAKISFTEIKVPFNSTPRLIFQFAFTKELVDMVSLCRNQKKLNLIISFIEF